MPSNAKARGQRSGDVGSELRWSTQSQLHSELGQQVAGAAGDTTVKNVTDDGGLQAFERLLVFQDSDGVEQRLRRVLMHAVPSVDDGDIEMAGHQVRGTRRGMAYDDAVRPDGAQRVSGIEHGFAFFYAGSGGLNECGHGPQRLSRKLEGRAGTSGGLVKQKYNPLPAQQRSRFLRIHAAGQVEQALDVFRIEVLNPEQRTACRLIHLKKCKPCIIRGSRGGRKGDRRPQTATLLCSSINAGSLGQIRNDRDGPRWRRRER